MSLLQELIQTLESGVHRVGQLEIQTFESIGRFILHHADDSDRWKQTNHGGLKRHEGSDAARDLSVYSDEGEYRFAKAQTNLGRGWYLELDSPAELLRALDLFYPAALGLWVASRRGELDVQNLRDKLNRQTGMYRFARNLSDAGAQRLVREVCGPAHQCARKILWQLDERTPLEDSEASRYNGIPGDLPESEAIPLLCREACNHFVAECRKASKEEAARQ